MIRISSVTTQPIAISDRAAWDNDLSRLKGLSLALYTLLSHAEDNPPGPQGVQAIATVAALAFEASTDLAAEVRKLLDAVTLAPVEGGAP